jgi:ribosomal protein L40E
MVMPQESLGYVKLEWTCPKCGSRNPGPEKTCLSCGAPQPDNIQFQQAERQEIITDQAELSKAKTGPDVHCAFCGTRNPAGATTCSQCGADLKQAAQREAGRVVGAFSTGPVKQVACRRCGTMNPETALKCAQCGAPTAAAQAAPVPAQPPSAVKGMPLGIIIIAVVGLLCLCAIIGFMIMSSRTEGQNGVVQSVHWMTSLAIMARQPVQHQDWQNEIPADAQVGNCTEKVHHVQDQPAPNSNKVCGTSYTVDKGSGYAEVVQDCQYEVLMNYCTYTVLEWQAVDNLTLEGADFSPSWAQPQLTEGQQIGEKQQTYTAVFETSKGQYTYTTSDYNLYQQLQIGSEWILNTNAFGQVVSVEPAK